MSLIRLLGAFLGLLTVVSCASSPNRTVILVHYDSLPDEHLFIRGGKSAATRKIVHTYSELFGFIY